MVGTPLLMAVDGAPMSMVVKM
eukprot:COSAG01_NODE_16775_length_1205_cov_32.436709_3_plen_21_part_01